MKEQMSPNRDNNWGLNLLTLAYDTPGARVVWLSFILKHK